MPTPSATPTPSRARGAFAATLLPAALAVAALPAVAGAGLEVTAIGKSFTPNPLATPISQTRFDNGGSTSVRNEPDPDFKDQGYYQRNRDLGQTFTTGADGFALDAVVLRTGASDSAVKANTPGASVFLQLFRLDGTPTINDNGTPQGTNSTHGFTSNHRADDFVEGVTYTPLRVAGGGVFPNLAPTTDGSSGGKLVFLRFDLTGEDQINLAPNTRYGFLVGLTNEASDNGFTLANRNDAADPAAPSFDDSYSAGFGIRREGDGTLPPTRIDSSTPPSDPAQRQALLDESLFGPGRFSLSPTTDGFPDVDTYRDLQFYIESAPLAVVPEPAGVAALAGVAGALLRRRGRRA